MDGKRKGFLVALVIGLLAGPAVAVGATRLFGADPAAASPATTTEAAATTVATSTTVAAPDPSADLAAACGPEGALLVAGEAAGTLSTLQQAALEALRPICAAAGRPLGAAAAAGEGTASAAPAAVPASAGVAPAPAPSGQYEDQYEDDEYEDDSYEDEEDGADEEDD